MPYIYKGIFKYLIRKKKTNTVRQTYVIQIIKSPLNVMFMLELQICLIYGKQNFLGKI